MDRRAIDYYLKACATDAPNFIANDNLSVEDALACGRFAALRSGYGAGVR